MFTRDRHWPLISASWNLYTSPIIFKFRFNFALSSAPKSFYVALSLNIWQSILKYYNFFFNSTLNNVSSRAEILNYAQAVLTKGVFLSVKFLLYYIMTFKRLLNTVYVVKVLNFVPTL